MSGASLPFRVIGAASTNATSVCAQGCRLTMLTAGNINDQEVFLKLYDKASAPTVGTDTPVYTFPVPGNTRASGTNIPIPDGGIEFKNGLALAITAGIADSDVTAVSANEQVVNGAFR